MVCFLITILGYILAWIDGSITSYFQLADPILWSIVVYTGVVGFQVKDFSNGTKIEMNRGYFYSLWEAYKPEYVVLEKSMSIKE